MRLYHNALNNALNHSNIFSFLQHYKWEKFNHLFFLEKWLSLWTMAGHYSRHVTRGRSPFNPRLTRGIQSRDNAPSCIWHAYHFNLFTILKHFNWEKFNHLFISYMLRNHSQTEVPFSHTTSPRKQQQPQQPLQPLQPLQPQQTPSIMHLLPCSVRLDYFL